MKKIKNQTAAEKLMALSAKREKRQKVKAMEEDLLEEDFMEDSEDEEEEDSSEEAPAEDATEEASEEEDAAEEEEDAEDDEVSANLDTATDNGGFEDSSLKNAGEFDAGEEDYGAHVPNEIADAVAAADEDDTNDSFSPGIVVPPGLEDAVMAIADPSSLSAGEAIDFDMIPFLPQGATTVAEVVASGAHWMLCANGEPLAKISLEDQDNKDKIAAHFVHADYARSVVEGIGSHGLKATLDHVKAKPYVARIDANANIAKLREELEVKAATDLKQVLADSKAKLMENLDLVLKASAANLFVTNPLKDSLIQSMVAMNISEASAAELVDNAYFSKGKETVAGFLDQAEAWSNYGAESQRELSAMVNDAQRRSRPLPSERELSPAQRNSDYNQELANTLAANAVPVAQSADNTIAASAHSPEPAKADSKLSFRSKFGGFR